MGSRSSADGGGGRPTDWSPLEDIFADTAAKHYSGVDSDLATAITNLMPPPPNPHLRARLE